MLLLGDIEIRRIEETVLKEPTTLFAEWRKEIEDERPSWLASDFYLPAADAFVISIHSWLLRTKRQTILIDTCGGNAKERPASPRFHHLDTPYLERLRQAGVVPEKVDYVICTHLHVDHVGWNTRLVDGRWVPTFSNATYVLSRLECEARDPKRGGADQPPAAHLIFEDSVRPVLDSAKTMIVEGDEEILDGIDLVKTPGHAPGHMAVRVRSRGQEAMFIGDIMHQPAQVYNPSWNSKFCENAELARSTRGWVLEHCAEHGSMVCPAHFGRPHCGSVNRRGDRFAFVPADRSP